MLRFVLGLVILAVSADAKSKGSPKMYWQLPIPASSPSAPAANIGMVPASCVMFHLFCPPWYTGGSSGGAGGAGCQAVVPSDLAAQRSAALANGNAYRSRHGANPLTRDPTLDAEAQAYAEQLANTRTFQHSNAGGRYGENLARLPCPGSISAANDAWYNQERAAYCPAPQTLAANNAHFTQMLWKDTTAVGYGVANDRAGNSYIVARYTPPGNYIGLESANVQC